MMTKGEKVAVRWTVQHRVRIAIDRAKAECLRKGVAWDDVYATRLIKAAGRAVILDDDVKAKPGKGGRRT